MIYYFELLNLNYSSLGTKHVVVGTHLNVHFLFSFYFGFTLDR